MNASNCSLLKMNSFRGFPRTFYKFLYNILSVAWFSEYLFQRTPLDGCFYEEALIILEALVSKWMLSSLSNRDIFFSDYFYSKDHPKNTYLHFYFHDEREFHHFSSSCFHDYFLHRHYSWLAVTPSFLNWRFWFFQSDTLSTLVIIIYIKLIYMKGSF